MARIVRYGVAAALGLLIAAPTLAADRWTISGDESKISYGSIKKELIGEVNHFGSLSGGVDADGMVAIDIDLLSVETWVDIRNERMRDIVFAASPKAALTAEIDLDAIEALGTGETTVLDVGGTLAFAGEELDIYTEMFVARLSDTRALVTTDEMIMVSTEELGIDAAIDELMSLADLPSITRAAPVTVRLVFELTGEGA
ncbi:MAG: YceI family protein [Pseudomonadota bacterium]